MEGNVSLNDREYENNSVKDKFHNEASVLNYIFGLGASARYDVYLSKKVIYENHNVHVGIYSEYLKRGGVGLLVLILINLIVICRAVLDRDYLYNKNDIGIFFLFWFYVLSVVYWFTWSAMFFTYMLNWIYIGLKLSGRRSENYRHNLVVKWR
ncbi:hypothetical protein GCM10007941_29360 [Amphritea balenae]|nr:hypothetical protein GCM10007941_29360 [Amphritea balenae]